MFYHFETALINRGKSDQNRIKLEVKKLFFLLQYSKSPYGWIWVKGPPLHTFDPRSRKSVR